MAKMHFTRSAFPATRRVTAADVEIGDFVIVGAIKGFALEATRVAAATDGSKEAFDEIASLEGTCLIGFGEVEAAPLVADGGGSGIAEGDYLKWDGTLLAGDGAFTDTAADSTDYDAIAGLGVVIAAGADGTGEVLIPAPYGGPHLSPA
jgi:hypothetical protein